MKAFDNKFTNHLDQLWFKALFLGFNFLNPHSLSI